MAKSYDEYMLATGYERSPVAIPPDVPSIMPIFVPGLQVPGATNPAGPSIPLQIALNPPAGAVDYTNFTPPEAVPDPIYARAEDYGQAGQYGQNDSTATNLTQVVTTPLTSQLRDKLLQQAFGEEPLPVRTSGVNWGLVLLLAVGGILLLNSRK